MFRRIKNCGCVIVMTLEQSFGRYNLIEVALACAGYVVPGGLALWCYRWTGLVALPRDGCVVVVSVVTPAEMNQRPRNHSGFCIGCPEHGCREWLLAAGG